MKRRKKWLTGRLEYNPALDLTSAMQWYESTHYPFLTVDELVRQARIEWRR